MKRSCLKKIQLNKPKRCIKWKAPKAFWEKPGKATRFNYDTHDTHPFESPLNKGGLRGVCILQESGLAIPEGYKVSRAGLFHNICLPNVNQFLQLVGKDEN